MTLIDTLSECFISLCVCVYACVCVCVCMMPIVYDCKKKALGVCVFLVYISAVWNTFVSLRGWCQVGMTLTDVLSEC